MFFILGLSKEIDSRLSKNEIDRVAVWTVLKQLNNEISKLSKNFEN